MAVTTVVNNRDRFVAAQSLLIEAQTTCEMFLHEFIIPGIIDASQPTIPAASAAEPPYPWRALAAVGKHDDASTGAAAAEQHGEALRTVSPADTELTSALSCALSKLDVALTSTNKLSTVPEGADGACVTKQVQRFDPQTEAKKLPQMGVSLHLV